MKIIKITNISKQGKITIPVELRRRWNLSSKTGKIVWYDSDSKIYIEVMK